jgi:hypothetical protein
MRVFWLAALASGVVAIASPLGDPAEPPPPEGCRDGVTLLCADPSWPARTGAAPAEGWAPPALRRIAPPAPPIAGAP